VVGLLYPGRRSSCVSCYSLVSQLIASRDALNPYFSVKAVGQMEELLRSKTNKLQEILDTALHKGNELNLSDAFFAYSNDVVRSFSFGNDNSLLNDLEEAKKQRVNLARLLTGVPVNKHFPWVGNVLAKGLPMVLGKKGIPPAVSVPLIENPFEEAPSDRFMTAIPTRLCSVGD
jgi:hypothetical protein